ncbi:hypothetical protein [Haladaptatus halobius]|uniref:hypothetical protein n=1 Tax=Haladaptatus halobius TaxID=2884875 RepID=UPI001D0A5220|nr:hypothetical protein [Haladaptatus halobius]
MTTIVIASHYVLELPHGALCEVMRGFEIVDPLLELGNPFVLRFEARFEFRALFFEEFFDLF